VPKHVAEYVLSRPKYTVKYLAKYSEIYVENCSFIPRCKKDLRSSTLLRSVCWLLFTDVSVQYVGPIFKGHAVQDKRR
jgi:hypothetical protein